MFIEINSEKIIKLTVVTCLIVFGVYSSLLLNKGYAVGPRAKIAFEKTRATLAYSKDKIGNGTQNTSSRPFNIATAFVALGDHREDSLLQGVTIWGAPDTQSNAASVPVLVYHGIPDEGTGSVDKNKFLGHLKALKDAGWQTVALADFYSFIRGEKDLPDKSFLLTFLALSIPDFALI